MLTVASGLHVESVGPPGVLFLILGGSMMVMMRSAANRGKNAIVVFMAVGVVLLGSGMFGWFTSLEQYLDASDRRIVQERLADGHVELVKFYGSGADSVRVARVIEGGRCEATFDIEIYDHDQQWPLADGSGRNPTKECGLEQVRRTNSYRVVSKQEAQAYYLDRLFARQ